MIKNKNVSADLYINCQAFTKNQAIKTQKLTVHCFLYFGEWFAKFFDL